jgi:hypothetical protein
MQLRQLLSQVSVKNLHELGIDGTFAKFILFLPGFLAAGISSRVRRALDRSLEIARGASWRVESPCVQIEKVSDM